MKAWVVEVLGLQLDAMGTTLGVSVRVITMRTSHCCGYDELLTLLFVDCKCVLVGKLSNLCLCSCI